MYITPRIDMPWRAINNVLEYAARSVDWLRVSSAWYYEGVSICFAYFELRDGALCCTEKVEFL